MTAKRNNVAIIGLGSFGEAVAQDLSMMGDRVFGIDIDPKIVSRFSDELDSVVEADATDKKALAQCSLQTYDAVVVSIGENTESSILAAMNVLELDCKRVWVKAQNATHRRILQAIGVPNIVQPEQAHGVRIAQVIHNPRLVDYLSLGDGHYLASVLLPAKYIGSKIAGMDLSERFSIRCIGIWRNNQLMEDNFANLNLLRDDCLLLAGRTRDIRHFADR